MGQLFEDTLLANMTLSDSLKLGHQEIERIIEELEKVYTMSQSEWLSAEPIQHFLCNMLGYEDENELEDALHSSFVHFLSVLPNVELRKFNDQVQFKMELLPSDPSKWVSKKMVLKVTQPRHLWNVVLKSSVARVEVPEIGLEISPDGRNRFDTIWNLLSTAALDLSVHVNDSRSESDQTKIVNTLFNLTALRDVDYPWTLVVVDPSGYSRFTEMEEVNVTENYIDEGSCADD